MEYFDSNISGIYCIENITTKVKYIGSAKVIKRRWQEHVKHLKKGNHKNKHLQSSWIKHGQEDFNFYILEVVDFDNLILKEQFWLDEISKNSEIYNKNMNVNGFHGRSHSQETKIKISETKKNQNLKTIHSPETRKKISQILTGVKRKPLSEEHKEKISKSSKRHPISEDLKKKHLESNALEYELVDPDGNLHVGKNISELCRINNLDHRCICLVIRGLRKHHKNWTKPGLEVDINFSKKHKQFKLKDQHGNIYEGTNLTQFCKDHNLNYNCIIRVLNGKRNFHLGWIKVD